MVTSNEARSETPLQFSELTNTILKPQNVRNQFNTTIRCYKILNNTHTTIEFLQHSLKSRTIPPTFIIKNTLYNNTDQNETKIRNLLHQTSTTLIKITIDSLKTKESTQFKKNLDELHNLLSLIPSDTDKDLILDKCTRMEANFRQQTKEKSIQRLRWLKQRDPTHKEPPDQRTTKPPKHRMSPNINKHETPTNTNDKANANTEGSSKEPDGRTSRKRKQVNKSQQYTTIQQ